jgi:hypothetical protein
MILHRYGCGKSRVELQTMLGFCADSANGKNATRRFDWLNKSILCPSVMPSEEPQYLGLLIG